ncbi:aldo/keto reductase [Alicyclobacillus ferrooxydans]|uniref:Aldo/keto reductase n=1 Tax=Alicyclobacillus ferrooxydans TaxID=471514 RepID=A0A0P9GTE8_9BACL|nr:aldo/keto reductase [Alicyclobacillus ferrooxydans]KPV44447.1 aldo/keto reductase [Alicyclobacillus ferrooxydans]
MKPFPLQDRDLPVSRIVLGCMGLGGDWNDAPIEAAHIKQAHEVVEAALETDINMFDHADIYRMGKAERVFGEVLKAKPGLRDQIFIQSKCGIRFPEAGGVPGRYDFSEHHIVKSVDGILARLGVEYIDFLLLHRPDPLMEPEEVASALSDLHAAGKVRWFGVSNMNAGQIELLQAYSDHPFVINQLEMSLLKHGFVETGVHVNQEAARANVFPDGTMEYMHLQNIQVQAWSPLALGYLSGRSLDGQPDNVRATAKLVQEMAEQKGTSAEAVLLAWLMRHPAGIQPVIGTTNTDRIRACGQALQVKLSREEWYKLYVTSRGKPLP